jgi:hypothetical protein
MIKVMDEQENYLLVTDGSDFAVVEGRAERFYGLRNRARHGVPLDDAGVAELMHENSSHSEREARDLLAEVATKWRDLFERVR